jgi:hypothetical protein
MPVVAVPAVAAAMAALLALLVLWGVKVFANAVAGVIPKDLPILGSKLHDLVLGFATIAGATLTWIMAQWVRPVINLVLGPVYRLVDFVDSVYNLARTTAASWSWLLNSAIPSVIGKLEHYAMALYNRAHAFTMRVYNLLHHYAYALYQAAHAFTMHVYNLLHHYAFTLYQAAHAYAAHLYSVVHHYAYLVGEAAKAYTRAYVHAVTASLAASIDALRKSIKAELATAEAYADTVAADVLRATQHAISSAVAGVITVVDVDSVAGLAGIWDGVIDDVTTLEGVIGADLPDIGAAVRAIPRAIPGDLAGALTAVGAISIPMLRYMARCGVPNCRNLSQLGRELRELIDALAGGAFLALLVELVTNPVGTAHWLNDNVGGLAEEAVNDAKSVLGV